MTRCVLSCTSILATTDAAAYKLPLATVHVVAICPCCLFNASLDCVGWTTIYRYTSYFYMYLCMSVVWFDCLSMLGLVSLPRVVARAGIGDLAQGLRLTPTLWLRRGEEETQEEIQGYWDRKIKRMWLEFRFVSAPNIALTLVNMLNLFAGICWCCWL